MDKGQFPGIEAVEVFTVSADACRVGYLFKGFPGKFFPRIAQHPGEKAVDQDKTLVFPDNRHPERPVFEDPAEFLFADPECVDRLPASRDVTGNAKDGLHMALLVKDRGEDVIVPPEFAMQGKRALF